MKLFQVLLLLVNLFIFSCKQSEILIVNIDISESEIVWDCDQDTSIPCNTKVLERIPNEQFNIKFPYIGGHGPDRIRIYNEKGIEIKYIENSGDFELNTESLTDGKYLISISGCNSGGGIFIDLKSVKE